MVILLPGIMAQTGRSIVDHSIPFYELIDLNRYENDLQTCVDHVLDTCFQ